VTSETLHGRRHLHDGVPDKDRICLLRRAASAPKHSPIGFKFRPSVVSGVIGPVAARLRQRRAVWHSVVLTSTATVSELCCQAGVLVIEVRLNLSSSSPAALDEGS